MILLDWHWWQLELLFLLPALLATGVLVWATWRMRRLRAAIVAEIAELRRKRGEGG